MVHDSLIEILSSEMSVTVGGNDLKDTVINSKDGHIESTTTKIENHNIKLSRFIIKTISDSGSRWLIKNSNNIQTSNSTGIFSSLSLPIIEISGDSNNSVCDFRSEIILSDISHFSENHGGDLFRGVGGWFTVYIDSDVRFRVLVDNFEG